MAAAGGGSGGGGREIEAGRAFVALGLKDTVASGLDKLKGKLSSFAEDAKKAVGTGLGLNFGSKIADTLGDLAKGGMKLFKDEVLSLIPGTESAAEIFREMADSTEKAAKESAKIVEQFGKLAAFEKGGTLAALRGREADSLGAVEAELEAKRAEAQKVMQEVEGMNMAQRGLAFLAAGTGMVESRGEILKEAAAQLKEAEKGLDEVKAKRAAALEGRGKIIDPTTDPEFLKRVEDLSQGMGDALDTKLKAMGEFERAAFMIRRENEAANEATQQRLKDLQEEARITDRQLKDAEERARIAKDFATEMRKVEFDRITKDLAPGAKGLAGLIDRGFSNDQILELQALQRSLREPGGTMTKGLGASANAALSLGIADQWKAQEKLMELTNQHLDDMRQNLDALTKNLAMR